MTPPAPKTWPCEHWCQAANPYVAVACDCGKAEVRGMAAELDRLRALVAAADEFGDRHVIELREDGYTIAHPLSCRATGLFSCPINDAALLLEEALDIGRFEATVHDGKLTLGERIPATARPEATS